MAAKELEEKLAAEWMDMSMPGVFPEQGGRHPVTDVERRCLEVLRQLGFEWVDGPEIEDAFHNFDALNVPKHHPARDMQDTFWVTVENFFVRIRLRYKRVLRYPQRVTDSRCQYG